MRLLDVFTPSELQRLVCGNIGMVDLATLKENMIFVGFEDDKPEHGNVKSMFLEVLASFSQDEIMQFFTFVTGLVARPASGLRSPIQVKLWPEGADERYLPVAHTCSYTLDLPQYTSKTQMDGKLRSAIVVKDFQIM